MLNIFQKKHVYIQIDTHNTCQKSTIKNLQLTNIFQKISKKHGVILGVQHPPWRKNPGILCAPLWLATIWAMREVIWPVTCLTSVLWGSQTLNAWNPKQQFINGCFNWMIPNLYIGNGCFTKHPFFNGCLGFQVYGIFWVWPPSQDASGK